MGAKPFSKEAASAFYPTMRTNVYVDGFNLYYGCMAKTPYKWLDIDQLARRILPKASIHPIRYFTAIVQARPNDPTQPDRQRMYIRALETIPHLSVHYGRFLSATKRAKVVNPAPSQPSTVEVYKTEEKGSDVNLATYLLTDCFDNDFEQAVVISNDSDLILPIKYVLQKGCTVGLLNPQSRPALDFVNTVTFVRPIRQGVLRVCQFPSSLSDANGTITKPAAW